VGSGAGLVGASVTALTFGAALAYSIILAESFSALGVTFNAPAFMQSRNNCLLVLTTGILLPLCSLKSLAALAPFSILGLLGILYTAVMMTVRLLDGSYAAGGALVDTIAAAAKPSFGKKGMNLAKTLMLTSMLSTNFICHYNAPRFLKEIKVSSVSQTLRRYNKMADQGFMGSIVFTMLMMSLGFLTFGGNTMGYILNNYASSDVLASFARIAIACALITSYPLTFLSLRDGMFDMLEVNPKDREKLHYLTTIGTLGLLTSLACMLHDVGFVVSIMGAIFGSWLIFGIPCILKNAYIKKEAVKENRCLTDEEKKSIVLNKGLMGTGSVLSVLGVLISIMQQLGHL
jgi:sodium-coupled neutral amino acid transporter 11